MEGEIIGLHDIFRILIRRKWIISAITILFMILGMIVNITIEKGKYINQEEKVYKSTASILVDTSYEVKSDNAKDIASLNQQMTKTCGSIALSRQVVDKTIEQLGTNIKTSKFTKNLSVNTNPDTHIIVMVYKDKMQSDVQKALSIYLKTFTDETQKIYPKIRLVILDQPSQPELNSKSDSDKVSTGGEQAQKTSIDSGENTKDKRFILAVSFLLGIICSFGVISILEYFDNSIKKKEQIERLLRLPNLGIIHGTIKVGNNDEDYKKVRTNILMKLKCEKKLSDVTDMLSKNTVIMVTSPSKGDGKTTTVNNLADSFSKIGYKTLIIDANGRFPMVDTTFNVENKLGLSDLLEEINLNIEDYNHTTVDEKFNLEHNESYKREIHAKYKDIIHKYIRKINNEKLYLLTWGTSKTNPADIFEKINVNGIMEVIREDFDYIIIDTPSIVEYADAQIISEFVDEIIITVSRYKTSKYETLILKELVDMLKLKIMGTVWIE